MSQYYIVYNYSKKDLDNKPILTEVEDEELMEVLDNAHHANTLISVYKLGRCILDWS